MLGRRLLHEKLAFGSEFWERKLDDSEAVIAADEESQYENAEAKFASEIELVKYGEAEGIITHAYFFLHLWIHQSLSPIHSIQ
jgi:hypothetical protein